MTRLLGEKEIAWFDLWSVEHFVGGMTIGGLLIWGSGAHRDTQAAKRMGRQSFLLAVLAVSYAWESLEFYIEAGYVWDRATYWMQGIEFIGNRLVTDPLLVLAGAVTAWRVPRMRLFAPVFSGIWLFFHVLVFPHCMFLQDEIAARLGQRRDVPSYQEWLARKPAWPPCPAGTSDASRAR